jgi:quercetin dioxygenase-like cupin family protein
VEPGSPCPNLTGWTIFNQPPQSPTWRRSWDDDIRLVLFGFDTGQELTEHTASMPALLQIISGEAQLELGEDTVTVGPGSWVHMPAHLPHSVLAEEPTVLLLTLIRR